MEYKNLECAYTIYKEKSITKAAKILYTSQSSVTKRLKKLENKLGFKIFNRTYNEMNPTSKGKIFLKDLEKLIELYLNTLSSFSKNTTTKYLIGMNNFDFPLIIINYLKRRKTFKSINITYSISSTENLLLKLFNKEINFSIFSIMDTDFEYLKKTFNDKNIKYKVLTSSKVNIFLNNNSPLYNKNKIYLSNLKGLTLIRKNQINIPYENYINLDFNKNTLNTSNTYESLIALENLNTFMLGGLLDHTLPQNSNIKISPIGLIDSKIIYLYAYSSSCNSNIHSLNKTFSEQLELYIAKAQI